jgi:sigma-B regulation protein RsbU (phosphoserine phosphatase)
MLKGASVLIVDDDQVSSRIVATILSDEGYETDVCSSGETALEKIRENQYDLVLLDVLLGKGMDGYQTCREIQKLNNDLPIILVTANQDDEAVNRGFLIGSSDYIKKPISRYELLARVNRTINYKRSEKNNLQLIYNLSKDLETAAKIQEAMLPKWIYLDKNMIFSSHYEAYEAVGGDLFDRIRINDDLYVVYLGDISGHGVQAALLMTAIKSILNILVDNEKDNLDLPTLVTHLNQRLCNELFIFDNYLTLMIGIIDLETNEFRYLNAGHPPVVVVDTLTGKPEAIESTGSLPLGWMANHVYKAEDMGIIPLSETRIVLLFSDGIYECVNQEGRQFGIQGVLDALTYEIRVESCVSLPFRIKQHLLDNRYNLTHDDFSLLAFQKRKTPADKEHHLNGSKTESVHFMTNLKAALKEVGKTAQQVEQLILNWSGDRVLAAKVELIVDEFLNNIVKYGYKYEANSAIIVEFDYKDGRLLIRFWDKGIAWTPDEDNYTIDNPYDFDRNLYSTEGRGVKIIMSMSNKFHRTRYDGLNETTVEIEV